MLDNPFLGTENVSGGVRMCHWIFGGLAVLTFSDPCRSPCQTNVSLIDLRVTLTPGCEVLWIISNTERLTSGGTMGHGLPVEMLQRGLVLLDLLLLDWVIFRLLMAVLYACTSILVS